MRPYNLMNRTAEIYQNAILANWPYLEGVIVLQETHKETTIDTLNRRDYADRIKGSFLFGKVFKGKMLTTWIPKAAIDIMEVMPGTEPPQYRIGTHDVMFTPEEQKYTGMKWLWTSEKIPYEMLYGVPNPFKMPQDEDYYKQLDMLEANDKKGE